MILAGSTNYNSCSVSVLNNIWVLFVLTDAMVERVPENINFPSEEEKIINFWNEKDCFQECLKQSKNRPR